MSVRNLDHLNLSVADFAGSAAWYGRVFGFEVVEQGLWRGAPFGILRAGNALLCMYEDRDRQHLNSDGLHAQRVHGVNHFALQIDDRDAWIETLRREKVPLSFGDGPIDYPNSRSWYVEDPTGYEIEVVSWNAGEPRF